MRRIIAIAVMAATVLYVGAQERKAQHKPYIDLRTLHYGIYIGAHLQDIDFDNIGPQIITNSDGTQQVQTVLLDADKWNPGFSVGLVADLRLGTHFNLRFTPGMHFGGKHLRFRSLGEYDEYGNEKEVTQDLKNIYVSLPLGMKFSAERFNNHRPYIYAGINALLNLTKKDQEYISLKRMDAMVELGIGCDFYLPFFKLIPELKFCYSLTNSLNKKHADELLDANTRIFANSVNRATNKMFVLTFYFE